MTDPVDRISEASATERKNERSGSGKGSRVKRKTGPHFDDNVDISAEARERASGNGSRK